MHTGPDTTQYWKSDNFMRGNTEKSNIAIKIFEKITNK